MYLGCNFCTTNQFKNKDCIVFLSSVVFINNLNRFYISILSSSLSFLIAFAFLNIFPSVSFLMFLNISSFYYFIFYLGNHFKFHFLILNIFFS